MGVFGSKPPPVKPPPPQVNVEVVNQLDYTVFALLRTVSFKKLVPRVKTQNACVSHDRYFEGCLNCSRRWKYDGVVWTVPKSKEYTL